MNRLKQYPNNADDKGYIAIIPMENGKWGIKVVFGKPDMGSEGIIFQRNSLEEAKQRVDTLMAEVKVRLHFLGILSCN